MAESDYKGFRFGVRTFVCDKPAPLLEAITADLAKAPQRAGPDALELIELGSVYVNDERSLNPARALKVGDVLRVHASPRRFASPSDLESLILAENTDSILVEKPSGLPADPTVDNVKENLHSFLEDLRGQPLFLTHRLALESEGLMLIAKSADAQARIMRAFTNGDVKRRYAAYVERAPQPEMHAPFKILSCEERRAETSVITENRQSWQLSAGPIGLLYRLEIEFSDARPREIRERLASAGTPIIGDRTLGSALELIDPATGKNAIAFRAISLSTTI